MVLVQIIQTVQNVLNLEKLAELEVDNKIEQMQCTGVIASLIVKKMLYSV